MREHLTPWIILINISLATFWAIISAVAAGIANTTISGALIIDSSLSSWIFTSYLMAVGTCLPLSGELADKYGAKCIFFVGLCIFIVGSGAAGFAFNFYSLIIFRIIEGIGAGIIFPLSLTIIAKEFKPAQLPMAMALYMGIGFGLGMAAGFLVGGFFGEFAPWQGLFFMNIAVGIPLLFITWSVHHETEPKKLPPFDFLGFFFFAVFVVSLLLIVTSAKQPWNTKGYTSPLIVTCYFLSSISFVLLIITELRVKRPVVALKLFKEKAFVVSCVTIAIIGVILFGTINLIPDVLEFQLRYEKWKIGLLMLSSGLVFGVVGPLAGFLSKMIDVRLLALFGLVLLAISCFMNMPLTIHSDQWQFTWMLIVRSIGVAISIGPITALGLSEVPKEILAEGTTLITFARQIGGAFGSSIMGLIIVDRREFHNQMFGAQVDPYSPAFQNVVGQVTYRLKDVAGFTSETATKHAKAALADNIVSQSQMAATNDAYFVIGIVTSLLALVLGWIIIHTLLKKKKRAEA